MGPVIRSILGASVCIFLSSGSSAQDRTIPELMASVNHDLVTTTHVQYGGLPSLDSVLRLTEVIVRGTLGEPRSYMSDDQKLVYTEYPIHNLVVLDDPKGVLRASVSRPDLPITFTQVGGSIPVLGRTYTHIDKDFPPLSPGSEYVFLLKRVSATFSIAGLHFGVFKVKDDSLFPATAHTDFAAELRGLPSAQAVDRVLSRRRAVRR